MIDFAERLRLREERLERMPLSEKHANAASHHFGSVDDCYRCIDCEILPTNAWKENCNA